MPVLRKLVDNDEKRYTAAILIRWKQQAEQEALREIESPIGSMQATDIDALKELSVQFDRAALQDSLRGCGSYKKFAESLTNLISLLNTGIVQGKRVTKRRSAFDNPSWRKQLGSVYHSIRDLRATYTSLVKSGEINEVECTCKFIKRKMYADFEMKKQEIIDQLNAILLEAGLPTIHGVHS